jgi:gamma-glutamyltranspeptidase/glutathione hydrolase
MSEFVAASRNNPFALKSKSMPYSSMSATIVSKNTRPYLVLGSPANERIISAVIQVISHWVDLNKGIESAVNEPRLHTISSEELMVEGSRVLILDVIVRTVFILLLCPFFAPSS